MNGYYELKKTAGGQFRFNLKAGNHEIILTSQTYDERRGAEAGIESVRNNGSNDARFEKKTSVAGEPYFVLKATNGQIIGTSEMYSGEAARDKGIESVKKNSPSTEVKDLTGA